MSIKSMFGTTAAAIVAAVAFAVPAQAADETFCRDYARAAVNQFRSAEKHERCDHYLRDNRDRWNANYRAHYDWCRDVNRAAAWEERNHRKHALQNCSRRER
jgi:hypothetical protein